MIKIMHYSLTLFLVLSTYLIQAMSPTSFYKTTDCQWNAKNIKLLTVTTPCGSITVVGMNNSSIIKISAIQQASRRFLARGIDYSIDQTQLNTSNRKDRHLCIHASMIPELFAYNKKNNESTSINFFIEIPSNLGCNKNLWTGEGSIVVQNFEGFVQAESLCGLVEATNVGCAILKTLSGKIIAKQIPGQLFVKQSQQGSIIENCPRAEIMSPNN